MGRCRQFTYIPTVALGPSSLHFDFASPSTCHHLDWCPILPLLTGVCKLVGMDRALASEEMKSWWTNIDEKANTMLQDVEEASHYYKNIDLSRLGNRYCPGFPTGNASPGQKGVPFCPGSGNRDKRGPFVPVGNTNRDKMSLFFHVFLFSILFLFQLYFCISIKLMYWNSVCMISTNIYIYI